MNKRKIIISSHSGFCFGVQRALNLAKKALDNRKTIYSLGPIIHNPQVVKEFSRKGLKVVKNINTLKGKNGKTLLIPSHGISPETLKKIKNIKFIDTTCPLVNRVQHIVEELKKKGYFIVIVGNKKHPEVRGLSGIAKDNFLVVKTKKDLKKSQRLKRSRKVALISQTTASLSDFKAVLLELAKYDFAEFIAYNTVCKNTVDRQNEAKRIAEKVDVMIIIGGKNSANTTKLAAMCREVNKNTHHVEAAYELKNALKKKKRIGIATGASTPPYAINEAVKRIKA